MASQPRWRHQPDQAGFTLLELLVVIIILGTLASIVVVATNGLSSKGEAASCASDSHQLDEAEQRYFVQEGSYGTEAQLVAGHVIREQSSLHDIVLAGGDYSIVGTGTCASSDLVASPTTSGGADYSGTKSVGDTTTTTTTTTTVPPTTTTTEPEHRNGIRVDVDLVSNVRMSDSVDVRVDCTDADGARESQTSSFRARSGRHGSYHQSRTMLRLDSGGTHAWSCSVRQESSRGARVSYSPSSTVLRDRGTFTFTVSDEL